MKEISLLRCVLCGYFLLCRVICIGIIYMVGAVVRHHGRGLSVTDEGMESPTRAQCHGRGHGEGGVSSTDEGAARGDVSATDEEGGTDSGVHGDARTAACQSRCTR